MNCDLLLRGPSGVGKTTIATKLAEEEGAVVVSIDRILDSENLEAWDADRIGLASFLRANDFALREIEAAHGWNRSSIVEGNFYWAEAVDDLTARASRLLLVATLEASVETCVVRDGLRPPPDPLRGPRAGDSLGESAVRQVHAMVKSVQRGATIDASGPTEQTLARLRRILNASSDLRGPGG